MPNEIGSILNYLYLFLSCGWKYGAVVGNINMWTPTFLEKLWNLASNYDHLLLLYF